MQRICLTEKLESNLSPEFKNVIKNVSTFSAEIGVKSYIIGGVVRDLLLGKPIYDLDIVIEGNAIDFVTKLSEQNICKISRENPDFGTVKAVFDKNLDIDFASTRTEYYPKKGHLPKIQETGCCLKSDVLRRDFTVNALALSLNRENFGEVIDFTGGLEDLEKKELKILHDQSFIDDPTRIIRGLRFCHKLGFNLEQKTKSLQEKYLNSFENEDICCERIKQVTKLAFNLNSAELFDDFVNQDIYKLITDEKPLAKGKNIKNYIDNYSKTIANDSVWLIYFACLAYNINTEKFNLNAKESDILKGVKSLFQQNTYFKDQFDIYNYYKNVPYESVIAYLALTNDLTAKKYIEELKDTKIELSGSDLLGLGFSEGKDLGKALKSILKEKVNGKINTKEEEIDYAKNILSGF